MNRSSKMWAGFLVLGLAVVLTGCVAKEPDSVGEGGSGASGLAAGSGGEGGAGAAGAAGGGGAGGSPPGDPEAVPTTEGLVKGYPHGDVWNWRGIPYAAPPVGDLRFRAPRPPPPRDDLFDARTFGDVCVQRDAPANPYPPEDCLGGEETCGPPGMSEDCLSLNIWSRDVNVAKPVMVWLHGGGLTIGAGSDQTYLANHLAHGHGEDVVVVTINYRLGVLGFLAHDALVGDDPENHPTTGNYGLLDMIRALEWVRDNIEGFGGDPNNVTIFGESGGGTAVLSLLATPLSDGLFHRAIVESGASPDAFSQYDLAKATTLGAGFADHVGCTGTPAAQLACLRAAEAQTLVDAAPGVVDLFNTPNIFFVIADGFVHEQTVYETFRDGNPKPGVPVLLGVNNDEGFLFGAAIALANPLLWYDGWLSQRFGPTKGPAIAALYQPAWYPWLTVFVPSHFRAVAEIASDWGFYRSAHQFVENRRRDPSNSVYVYHFEVPFNPPWAGPGAPHGTELAYVFDRLGAAPAGNQAAVIDTIQTYWKGFAATGEPVAQGLPTWPPMNDVTRPYLAIRDEVEPAVPSEGWLEFTDLGPWRPDGMSKLELIEAWDGILEEGYSPALVSW